ncbi:pilus assembly FimT family protein [Saccharophagus degradans]|uniref:Type II secretion system protein H n=1 Tax=Saccharophagus degradans (strain 2-40 / ATCC 43961 / DSM 17024) TaxID=203122 RepID=Q21LM5_SACD2|nr:type II secretion system protein [Saccharophagus degradans]ABD80404.1 conserved hypothetical protein [Saccharophagus degradans 2-40]
MRCKPNNTGFTLVELIAVIVVIAALSVTVVQRLIPASSYQLQGARDQLVTAFQSAQQLAMVRTAAVRLTTSGSQIDILQDTDNDGVPDTSVTIAGQNYPLTLAAAATLSSASFDFDRLGHTSSAVVVVTAGSSNVNVNVTATGYIY